jgi:hypothetical protein
LILQMNFSAEKWLSDFGEWEKFDYNI